ncbi:hypothetical protein Tco_1430208 [Tanacetum coccineum]
MPRKSFHQLSRHLQSTMEEVLPSMVGDRVNEITKKTISLYVVEGLLLDKQKSQVDVAIMIVEALKKECENLRAEITLQVTNAITNSIPLRFDSFLRNYMSNNILHIKFEKPAPFAAPYRTAIIRTRDHEDHQDVDARPEGESSAKRQKTSEHEQLDKFDAWMDSFGTNDDEVPTKEVSPEIIEEMSKEIDEAQLQKAVNDMLRLRCNSREEHYSWVLEKLKKYNMDVKYRYADPSPSDADAKYLQFYEEDIEDRLKH